MTSYGTPLGLITTSPSSRETPLALPKVYSTKPRRTNSRLASRTCSRKLGSSIWVIPCGRSPLQSNRLQRSVKVEHRRTCCQSIFRLSWRNSLDSVPSSNSRKSSPEDSFGGTFTVLESVPHPSTVWTSAKSQSALEFQPQLSRVSSIGFRPSTPNWQSASGTLSKNWVTTLTPRHARWFPDAAVFLDLSSLISRIRTFRKSFRFLRPLPYSATTKSF